MRRGTGGGVNLNTQVPPEVLNPYKYEETLTLNLPLFIPR